MGEGAMKGERRIFGGQKLHISDGNIVVSGLFVSWKCSVPMFSREEAKSICKNISLKVFLTNRLTRAKNFQRSSAIESKSTDYSSRLSVIRYFKSSSLFPVGIHIFCFKQSFYLWREIFAIRWQHYMSKKIETKWTMRSIKMPWIPLW